MLKLGGLGSGRMAEVSIGGAVGEGFSLIRGKPLTVLAWGLVQVVFFALMIAVMIPLYAPIVSLGLHRTPGATPDPATMQAMMQGQSVIYLFDLVSLMLNAVVYCAVWRSVLKPEQSQFAYLRVGAVELLLALLILVASIGFGVGLVVVMIPIAIIAGILAATHQVAAAIIFGVLAGIATVCGLIYVALRASLIGPMTVDDGQLRVSEAWALTRGKVLSLLAVILVLFVVLVAIEIVIGIVMVAVGVGALASVAGGLRNIPTLFQSAPSLPVLLGRLAPVLAIGALVWIPISGGIMAIMGAPWARAYLDLKPPRDIAATFA